MVHFYCTLEEFTYSSDNSFTQAIFNDKDTVQHRRAGRGTCSTVIQCHWKCLSLQAKEALWTVGAETENGTGRTVPCASFCYLSRLLLSCFTSVHDLHKNKRLQDKHPGYTFPFTEKKNDIY